MIKFSINDVSENYNSRDFRERLIIVLLMFSVVFFSWYLFSGKVAEDRLNAAEARRENLLSISEKIMAQYDVYSKQAGIEKDIALIEKRMGQVKSKMSLIDEDLKKINESTIPIGEIVLLLKDILDANNDLSLQSMKVYPSELLKNDSVSGSSLKDSFEKNMIAMSLRGNYSSILSYLKKIEDLEWKVYWQDVKYSVNEYPVAEVDIHLYTLSLLEERIHDI